MKKTKSPSIYRIITERFQSIKPQLTVMLVCFVVLSVSALTLLLGLDLYNNLYEKQANDVKRQQILSEIKYWQQVSRQYKGFRDAYFKLAVLEYQLRDFERSKRYLDKALAIDPNFSAGLEFEKILARAY